MKLKYSLTDDICFKYVFRDEKILTSLLNSFFSYIHANKKVVKIEVTTQKEMIGSRRKNKAFYGDILAYLDTNEIVSIEMYNKFTSREYKKSISYLARTFSDQLKEGEDYREARKVISINFMSGNYHLQNVHLVNDYGFVNKVSKGSLEDELLELFLVRLDLVKKNVYNNDETMFEKWVRFIKTNDLEEMENIAKGDQEMEQALKFMKRFVNDEEVQKIYGRMAYERFEGRDEGIEIGREAANREMVKNMLKKGYTVKEIAEITNLSIQEIESLKSNKKN